MRTQYGAATAAWRPHLSLSTNDAVAAAELRVVAVAPLRSDDSVKSWRRFRAPLFRCMHTCIQTCTHACMHTMHACIQCMHTIVCMHAYNAYRHLPAYSVCILTEKHMSSTLLRFASPATQPGSAAAPVRRLHLHVHAVHPANLVGRRRQLHVRGQARPTPCVRVSTRTSGRTLRPMRDSPMRRRASAMGRSPMPPRWGNPAATTVAGMHGCAHAWWSWC